MKKNIVLALILIVIPMSFWADKIKGRSYPLTQNRESVGKTPYQPAARESLVLFVQDGANFGPASTDSLWNAVLTNILGVGNFGWYGPTVIPAENGPSLDTMQAYNLVVWNNYDQWDTLTLTSVDQNNITNYISGGGRVWLISQDALYSGVPLSFFEINFYLQNVVEDYWGGSSTRIRGMSEATGDTFLVTSDLENAFHPDHLTPTSDAHWIVRDYDQGEYPGIFRNDSLASFWTIDGRQPNPWSDWEQLVTDMLLAFGIGVTMYDHDVRTVSIDIPAIIPEDTTLYPQATVKNYGTISESFIVTCTIEPGGYTSADSVLHLASGEYIQITFPDTFRFANGYYITTVYTGLAGDENPANDTLTKQIHATSPHDVGPFSIDIPSILPEDTTLFPLATVKNYGANVENLIVVCMIDTGIGSYVRQDTIRRLLQGESAQDTFPELFTFSNGLHTVTVFTFLPGDEDPTNDTLDKVVEARIGHDVGTISIDVPSTVPLDTTFSPQATVKNFGAYTETFDVACTIGAGAYTSTYNVVGLAPDDSLQVTFPDQFNFLSGFYTVTAFTELPTDEDLNNDTLEKVVEATGIAEIAAGSPGTFMFRATEVCKGEAKIELILPQTTKIKLAIYDAVGRLRSLLISGELSAGAHSFDVEFDLAAGVYFYNLMVESNIINKKFLIIE